MPSPIIFPSHAHAHGGNCEQLYWGPPSSSIDWCEANGVYTCIIYEFWNTISNLPTIGLGLFSFVYFSKLHIESRFKVLALTLFLIGVGSTAFHATLQFTMQLSDELPMQYFAAALIYVVLFMGDGKTFLSPTPSPMSQENLDGTSPTPYHGDVSPSSPSAPSSFSSRMRRAVPRSFSSLAPYEKHVAFALTTYCFLITISSSVANRIPIIHQVTFTAAIIFVCYRTYQLSKRCSNTTIVPFFSKTLILAIIGAASWLIDSHACAVLDYIPPGVGRDMFQLHSWWHLCTSFAAYLLVQTCVFIRQDFQGRDPALRWTCWKMIPFVEVKDRIN